MKPKFDLTKKFNEMNIKKTATHAANARAQKKAAGSKQRHSSQKKVSKGSSRPGSKGRHMIKKQMSIEVESLEDQDIQNHEAEATHAQAMQKQGGEGANWNGKFNLDLAKLTP